MNQFVILTIVLMVLVLIILFYVLIQVQKLGHAYQQKASEQELMLNKSIQENFFNFQNAIFSQLENSESQQKFIFDEINKSQSHLTRELDKNLREIKYVVDEKLHKTLEQRLSHSFKLVADSLSKVELGLGEMQALASGVGDLKKVLTNTKSRGVLGEIQLSNLLEQLLTAEQYAINVSTIPNTRNHVEFAIKFPGKTDELPYIWLPIDSKFPMELYEHLLDAYETSDKAIILKARKNLASSVRTMAAEITSKYVYPPYTTDFGIMFLPTESLYAEILRVPGLILEIQSKHKIMIVGPNNLGAFLTSLQQGFKSLAIERRTGEVWKLLSIIRTEFGKFGDILDKTQKKILEANKIIDTASSKSRTIERKLRSIEKINYLD